MMCQWLKNFSYVPQEVLLMDTDFNENISLKKDLTLTEKNLIDRLINELNLGILFPIVMHLKWGIVGKICRWSWQRIANVRLYFSKRYHYYG